VAAEAQACGTPVVAFARGALSEVVVDGVTGFLIPPGDVERAAASVGSVGLIDRRRCRQHAVDHLDLEACLDAYEALYASVSATLADRRRAASGG
jgi:glycosyltransferase involved in cell wall biosynthesis